MIDCAFCEWRLARVELRTTPHNARSRALAAGVADHRWTLAEIAGLLD
jgi:RimJ/RimL family protein N-acetyltransferase